jgi:hypothetical protein
VYYDKPAGNMFPSKSVTPEQRKLKGFNWRFVARPLNKDDIFRKVDLQPVAPKKGPEEPINTKTTDEPNNAHALNENKVSIPTMTPALNEKNVPAAAMAAVKDLNPINEVKPANTVKQVSINNQEKKEEPAVVKKKEEIEVVKKKEEPAVVKKKEGIEVVKKKEEPAVVKKKLVEPTPAKDTITTTLDAITFRVQIFALSKEKLMTDEKFQDLNDVQMYIEDGKFKYTAGIFSTREEAIKYRNSLFREGFDDAFVITFANGKRIYN